VVVTDASEIPTVSTLLPEAGGIRLLLQPTNTHIYQYFVLNDVQTKHIQQKTHRCKHNNRPTPPPQKKKKKSGRNKTYGTKIQRLDKTFREDKPIRPVTNNIEASADKQQ
jgi:hypothetical protein